ncbi:hypothetical protein [Hydrogenophaga taeniospiralis]|uniref:hypothetical protein n=1 Tax=Hydrogenophaga taeniospiralis TaxID=65656 RepID=UPI000ACFB87E|nr:hypothetical protein [Hydrogenophaga taeniospiralis]
MAKAPVPDTEAVRQTALRASWRRDRWVARRRLLGRWLLWCLKRYVLPIVLIVGLVLLLWLGVWPSLSKTAETARPAVASSIPLPPTPSIPPTGTGPGLQGPITPPPANDSSPSTTPASGVDPVEAAQDAGLRLETRWSTATTAQTPVQATPPAPPPSRPPSPSHLKPENWLHSKEP